MQEMNTSTESEIVLRHAALLEKNKNLLEVTAESKKDSSMDGEE
jgi:hypothetical protein